VLRSISGVMTPPRVSNPRVKGVTSRSRTSFTVPLNTPAWIAAPMATTSSGFTPLFGSLLMSERTNSCTMGIRVAPPTRTTSFISLAANPASFNALSNGFLQRLSRSAVICSKFARVSFSCKCFGPLASAVIYGRLISLSNKVDSSILAFSAASRSRCNAC
jgi:hypothetical protein